MTYPGPRGRETVRPMIPEIGWLRASAERARVWADADGDRLLVPLEDATRAVRDARAAARQRTVEGNCPDDTQPDARDPKCPACAAAHPDPPDMTNMCEGESPDHKPGITPAATPDERLREALRTMIDVYDRHDRWCGHYAQAPGDGIIHRIDGARNALAAADREAHLEPAPQNDATRAQIVAAKLIADREAPDEAEGQKITHGRHCTCTPCAVEDWTNPALASCGMHGKGCPQEYQPLGPAGSFTPPADDPKETTT